MSRDFSIPLSGFDCAQVSFLVVAGVAMTHGTCVGRSLFALAVPTSLAWGCDSTRMPLHAKSQNNKQSLRFVCALFGF